ncbi:homocysteine S-methyltransferase family protein [Burkholderia cepacia]|uniref:homocysteine S-methyltransferase family protein n=1 Tax=Burkholderia cepacia TaxID=292 RepID=UPI002AB6E2CE|nr:homocysteine S-methyltransferase family protein [Burkholderia cepacia]
MPVDPPGYAKWAEQWLALGAQIVGGCCGDVPRTAATDHRVRVIGLISARTGFTSSASMNDVGRPSTVAGFMRRHPRRCARAPCRRSVLRRAG